MFPFVSTLVQFLFSEHVVDFRKFWKQPMDLARGLRGSLLPRREDSIPSWSQLLTLNLFLSELLLLPSKFQVLMGD